ncbi:hypothetical protein TSACC_22482 [Terrimicrobium sacchariphilum]|uniref:PD-(D/E)XK endonuclease-like domain-containing protein n=1 Tax=Terrimicrobium sacchariphilum TaxID=690879 RepID=A0A146G8M6_TERSA|nr:hypothetical protein [Terrimicrobium sacchariphilum]GAT34059.1 hypothetical protein TSACC_22482 [Terrimicrobium sacchariphilum]
MKSFFPGFSWALPTPFTDPLGFCRFEQGDILYSSPDGYKPWDEAVQLLQWSIQVKSPSRAIAPPLKEDEGSQFLRNWTSPVTFELTHYREGSRVETITTTQGRLYKFLQTGDFAHLDASSPEPLIPLLVADAAKCLEQVGRDALHSLYDGLKKPHAFLMAFDPCNQVSKAKLSQIRRCLSHYPDLREQIFSPHELGLSDASAFVPTVSIAAFVVDTGGTEAMRDCLKKVLYKPSKTAKVSRFNLRAHGHFIPFKEKEQKEGLITISFAHGNFYRFRVDTGKAKSTAPELQDFFQMLRDGDCPNHFFTEPPTSSGLRLKIKDNITRHRDHQIIGLANACYGAGLYKSAHENLQCYFLQNDPTSIAVEIPIWLDAEEYDGYEAIFPEGGVLTGHIDLLRCEADGTIWIWDYKPNAYAERYAAGQIYSYAVMLSVRTGIPLERFRCGYFDESNAFTFEPSLVALEQPMVQKNLF